MKSMFMEDPWFYVVFFQWWGVELVPPQGGPASVSGNFMTNQDYTKVENVTLDFFFSSFAIFPSTWSLKLHSSFFHAGSKVSV